MDTSVVTRFWQSVEKTDYCWLWQKSKNSDGYGNFCYGGKVVKAHRFAYLLYADIPKGLQLDHLCRIRHCVNPQHLEPVTQQENLKRGIYWQSTKKHCKKGHKYTVLNTYKNNRGHRVCKKCMRDRWRIEHGVSPSNFRKP